MSELHNIIQRRHHRRAGPSRMARNPEPAPFAFEAPSEADLNKRDLLPRFSPTAVFPGDTGDSSTSSPPATTPATTAAAAPTTKAAAPATTQTSTEQQQQQTTQQQQQQQQTTTSSNPTTSSTTQDAPTTSSTSTTTQAAVTPTTTTSTPAAAATTQAQAQTSSATTPTVVGVTQSLPSSSVPLATAFTTVGAVPSSSTAAASATQTASHGTSTSAIVGGIAAGLVGVAGVIFVTMFLMRRIRKRGEKETEFNADAFRQSAVLVDDEPDNHYGATNSRGYNPRPPTMIERHMANVNDYDSPVAPMPSVQAYRNVGASAYANPHDSYDSYAATSSLGRSPSFNVGQVVPMSPTHAGQAPYAPFGQSPLGTPTAYDSQYNDQGQLVRHPSSAGVIYNPHDAHQSFQSGLNRQNTLGPNGHYVDMDRNSVTPFQAAQYAEIHKRLNDGPRGLGLGAVTEYEEGQDVEVPISTTSEAAMAAVQAAAGNRAHLSIPAEPGHADPESPFADPSQSQHVLIPPKPITTGDEVTPPSPVYTLERSPSAGRISHPPKLPEIHVPEKTFSPTSYDFPQTPSARPSPFASGFDVPTPNSTASTSEPALPLPAALKAGSPPIPSPVTEAAPAKRENAGKPAEQRPTSTYTVYDESDAYGGF